MPKILSKEEIRTVLEIIREKPRTWSEIKAEYKNKNKNLEIPDKSLARILNDYLGYWGIIKKDKDGRWWYVAHEVAVEDKNYNIAMNHSLIVLPGFVKISKDYGGILAIEKIEYVKLSNVQQPVSSYNYSDTSYGQEMVVEYAKEHLKIGYPEVWEVVNKALAVNKLAESVKELEKIKEQKEQEKITRITKPVDYIVDYIKQQLRGKILSMPGVEVSDNNYYLQNHYLETYMRKLAEHIFFEAKKPDNEIDWKSIFRGEDEIDASFAGLPVFELEYDYKKPIKEEILKILPTVKEEIKKYEAKEAETLERIEKELVEKKKSLATEDLDKNRRNADIELFKIVQKILSGEPLKGECKGCPKVCLYYQSGEEQGEENKK